MGVDLHMYITNSNELCEDRFIYTGSLLYSIKKAYAHTGIPNSHDSTMV